MPVTKRPKTKATRMKAEAVFDYLKSKALKGELATYGDVGKAVGLHHRSVRWPLGEIWQACKKHHLPHLNAICVNSHTWKPGRAYDVIGKDWLEMKAKVFNYDWNPVTWNSLRP